MFASPGNKKTKGLCFKVATVAIKKGGCPKLSPSRPWGALCKPPLECNRQLDPKITPIPRAPMFDGSPLLGFRHMVAPINKTTSSKNPLPSNCTGVGDVPKLPRGLDASTKMAPNLHVVLREMLQSKEVKGEIIENFLSHSPSIKRYDSAFRTCGLYSPQKGLILPHQLWSKLLVGLLRFIIGPLHKLKMLIVVCFCFPVFII